MRWTILLLAVALGACELVYYGDARDCVGECDARALPVSCRELLARDPTATDGSYLIDPDGAAPPREVYCDMSRDGGGWTLMTEADIAATTLLHARETREVDSRGGLVVTLAPLVEGCAPGAPHAEYGVLFAPGLPWTHIRARHEFSGASNCWSLFGDTLYAPSAASNVEPFDRALDLIYDEVRMGGAGGDAYPGGTWPGTKNTRCDDAMANFWDRDNGFAPRFATVVLRRADLEAPAGLATGADCSELNPATYWRYRDIFVR